MTVSILPVGNSGLPNLQPSIEGEPSSSDFNESTVCDMRTVIASDLFRPEKADLLTLAAVKAALKKATFGHLYSDETVKIMFEAGLASELFPNCAMDEDHPELARMQNWIEPSIDDLWKEENLETRALLLGARHVYGSDKARRDLILSVKGAGIFGDLAQALLQPPMTMRTKRPSWFRPFRPSGHRGYTPNLFETFGEEWRVCPGSAARMPAATLTNPSGDGQALTK